MKIAIVGSRNFTHPYFVKKFVDMLPEETIVVSGRGGIVDKTAEASAIARALETIIFPADWNKYGKRAGFLRNQQIHDASDKCMAFWDGKSKGTAHTISLFKKSGKPVEVVVL